MFMFAHPHNLHELCLGYFYRLSCVPTTFNLQTRSLSQFSLICFFPFVFVCCFCLLFLLFLLFVCCCVVFVFVCCVFPFRVSSLLCVSLLLYVSSLLINLNKYCIFCYTLCFTSSSTYYLLVLYRYFSTIFCNQS